MSFNSFSAGSGVSGVPAPKILANGRISRVDQLKAMPRKPGEASFFMRITIFSTTPSKCCR